MLISEESLGTDRATSHCLDALVAALAAIYVQGVKPQPRHVESVTQGLLAAQQVLLGSDPRHLGKGDWAAVCRRPLQAGCSLTLERPDPPGQQLVFSVDRHNTFFNGFIWETGGTAHFFQLFPAGAGWSLRSATIEQAPWLDLKPGLPWTATPDRGLPEGDSGEVELFSTLAVVGKLVAATAMPPSTPAAKQCSRCQLNLPEKAKFCPGCGAPVGIRTCPGCRKPLESKARFCGWCGTRCPT